MLRQEQLRRLLPVLESTRERQRTTRKKRQRGREGELTAVCSYWRVGDVSAQFSVVSSTKERRRTQRCLTRQVECR